MIFVTVGTQLPFDRLVHAVDQWACNNPGTRMFAQIGPGTYLPKHITYAEFIDPAQADEYVKKAEVVVAHAGMGSVLTALKFMRPIILLPRRYSLNEHRNDHQMATARWLSGRPGIHVAWDETELPSLLDNRGDFAQGQELTPHAGPTLIKRLEAWIDNPGRVR